MGYIIRNGISYFGDNAVELTQAQYDALPSSKLTDGVDYYITDAQAGAPLATEIAMSSSDSTSVASKIGEVQDLLGGLLKLVQFPNSESISVPANGAVNITANQMNISIPTGYTPVAICTLYCSSNNIFMRSFSAQASGTSSFGVARNVSNTAENAIFNVLILYAKSSILA